MIKDLNYLFTKKIFLILIFIFASSTNNFATMFIPEALSGQEDKYMAEAHEIDEITPANGEVIFYYWSEGSKLGHVSMAVCADGRRICYISSDKYPRAEVDKYGHFPEIVVRHKGEKSTIAYDRLAIMVADREADPEAYSTSSSFDVIPGIFVDMGFSFKSESSIALAGDVMSADGWQVIHNRKYPDYTIVEMPGDQDKS